ncbi:uncharacterized protein B0T15DRAFT_379477, partial [Chaetomium strumarium]
AYRTYTPDHCHRWGHLAADMDDQPRAGAAKRMMPALCLGTAHKIDEDDLVARSAAHGDAEVQTHVLAAHVEPAAGGSPGMGNGYDEDSDCDDGLGDGIASGRYDIGSAAEPSSVADINDANNTTVLGREGEDYMTTEASPAAKTSHADDNIIAEREGLAAGISNAVDAAMSKKAGKDNAMTKTSSTAKASDMDNTMFEREGAGYRQSDDCPDCSRDEPLATQQVVPM